MYYMVTRKKQQGGVIVTGVASNTFPEYRACHGKDCVPSAFYELGMYTGTNIHDPKLDFISRCFPIGVSEAEIITILDEAYQIPHFSVNYTRDMLQDLLSRMLNNEALLASTDLHQFIILKEADQLFVREPYLNQSIPIDSYFDELATESIYHISVIFTEHGDRVPLHGNARITPYLIQKLASEGKLPHYRFVANPDSAWSIAAQKYQKNPRGGTKRRYRKSRCTGI